LISLKLCNYTRRVPYKKKLMTNRARRRAERLVICFRNKRMINIIRTERMKVEFVTEYLEDDFNPSFISYTQEQLEVANGFTAKQGIAIEFEQLLNDSHSGKINFKQFNNSLDNLLYDLKTGKEELGLR
jgi:hypothetical protein